MAQCLYNGCIEIVQVNKTADKLVMRWFITDNTDNSNRGIHEGK